MLRPLCLVLTLSGFVCAQELQYTVSFPNAAHHEAEVELRIPNAPAAVELRMSRSSPGRYAVHDFARNVYQVRVTDGAGKELAYTRPNAHQWNVTGHDGTVIVRYTLFGNTTDGTNVAIDSQRAELNAPAALLYARALSARPASVTLQPPVGSGWRVATQLEPIGENRFRAPHLQYLLDSPILLGKLMVRDWTAGRAKIAVTLQHTGTEAEATALARQTEAIVNESEGVYGELPEFDYGRYVFLVDLMPQGGGGGMEHRNSTMISSRTAVKEAHNGPIGTIAHEFFHAWNVERIRPRALEPFDFEDANISEELWFAEGFTTYYTPLLLHRAGLISLERMAETMARPVGAVLSHPGRELYSAAQMSQWAPFADGYTGGAVSNLPNVFISYYTYGAALGLGVDLAIRREFPGKSLDDWMRAMWLRHGRAQKDQTPLKPYTMKDLEESLASVTSAAFAQRIFQQHIRGRQPLDYAALLEQAGLLLRPAEAKAALGATGLRVSKQGVELTGVPLRGGPLYAAGLDHGDRLVELDGKTFATDEELNAWLKTKKPGEVVKAKADGSNGKRDLTITLAALPEWELVPFEQAGKTLRPAQSAFRRAWLASKALRPLPEVKRYCSRCKRAHPFAFEYCPFDGKALEITLE